MRSCKVLVDGIPAGVLEETGTLYRFRYDPAYIGRPDASPVCAAMPLSAEEYTSSHLFPFFSNMLSEGSNRTFQERLHHLTPGDDFGLLLKTCSYDTIGNVTVEAL